MKTTILALGALSCSALPAALPPSKASSPGPGGAACPNYNDPVINHKYVCDRPTEDPKVRKLNVINQCSWPIVLRDWGCQIPSKQTCTVGESCTGTTPSTPPFISELPTCADEGHKMRTQMKDRPDRIEWYIPGSRGVGGSYNYNITDFLEINTVDFQGAGTKLGHSSWSQWQGYSMSKQYVTRDVQTGKLACQDSGGKTTVPDPILTADGSLACGDPNMQCGGEGRNCVRPYHLCYPPEYGLEHKPDYLKKHAFAINRDEPESNFLTSICNAVDYVCKDDCMAHDPPIMHTWSAGTQICDCPAEVDLEITICGVTN